MMTEGLLPASAITACLIASLAITAGLGGFEERLDPDLSIHVVGAEVLEEGGDLTSLTGHYIQGYRLRVENRNEVDPFPITVFFFFARTANGSELWCRGMEPVSDPAVKAGASSDIGIYFLVPEGERIDTLWYLLPSGERIDVPFMDGSNHR